MRPSKEPLAEPNGLGISTTNSTGPLTAESTLEKEEVPTLQETEQAPQPSEKQPHHHGHKHGHKRIRSKEKNGKTKSTSQPERECSVM
jgi:hypothetical protein